MSRARWAIVGTVALLFAAIAPLKKRGIWRNRRRLPEALAAEIQGLKATKVAWREIAWKSCLLEGLKESRAKNKPALLWVFIDRPIDDARC